LGDEMKDLELDAGEVGTNLRLRDYSLSGDSMTNIRLSDFEAFSQDLRWLSDNLDALRPKYENKYVLVKDKIVVAASANYDQLLDEAVKHKVDVSKVVIERIIPKNVQLML